MRIPRTLMVTAAVAGLTGAGLAAAPHASAEENWTLNYNVSASTTVAKLNTTSTTTGTATTTLTPSTGAASTVLTLNQFQTPVKLFGFQVATATIKQDSVGPSTGKIDFSTLKVNQTSKSNLRILQIAPFGLKNVNLVGPVCTTAEPATINVSGTTGGLFDPTHLSGTFTIPKFKNCGLLTSVVSSQVSGPGNTIKLTLTPR